ncbi:MAG TPA: NYN domain-containing protein, partial [Solirubrobacteraceae bacterium]|nr:NYN domain-containing protein [Solirubrobacteraceae bacterium]
RRDSADDEIVRLLMSDGDPASVRVVTSDRWLVDRVHATGATVQSADSFRTLLESR